jgi:outer membrane protein OmpA-like peptidoglycan-associated protein
VGSLAARSFAAVLVLGAGSAARAQQPPCVDQGTDPVRCIDVQLFHPTPALGTTFTIESPGVPRHLSFEFGLALNFALEPLERTDPATEESEAVVDWLFQGELLLAMGLFEFLELGVAVPIAFASAAEGDVTQVDLMDAATSVGFGDVRLNVKIPILRGDFALAARALIGLPSGDSDNFLGQGYWWLYPSVVVSGKAGPNTIGGELGYRLRQQNWLGDLEQDDELQLALGLNAEVAGPLSIIAESQLRLGVAGQTMSAIENPMEADLGVRLTFGALTIDVGAGTGLLAGYGAPLVRTFAIARFATEPDRCPAGPEDFDGFEDGDFCGDPDNDGDTLADELDTCPNDAEDIDEFADEDGCPDPDNDGDGSLDPEDRCPTQSEDIDGFADNDGCPEPDNDDDGLLDGVDQCKDEPEDLDQYEDEDGCPEPGPGAATVTVTERRILISERIYFDFDADTIRPVSLPLLDQVAAAIRNLAASRRVRVEGYTDSEGDDRYNTDLSYRRARSVVHYLVSRGVPRARVTFEGYGEARPVAPNDSPQGRALNRRVEFTILEAGE